MYIIIDYSFFMVTRMFKSFANINGQSYKYIVENYLCKKLI